MLRPNTTAAPIRVPHVPATVLVPPPGPRTVVMLVGTVTPAGMPSLCDRVVAALLTSGAEVVTCDVSGVEATDVATVDALARMQLTARRQGGSIRLRRPSRMLQSLIFLTGLSEVVTSDVEGHRRPG